MVRVRRGLAAVAVALAAGVLAGCTGGGSDMPGLTASPSPSVSPTPTPTPTPTQASGPGVVVDVSDPDLQLVVEDVPHDLAGDAADVYNAIALWVRESWRSITTNQVSPYLYESSSAAVIESVEADVALAVERGNTIGGVHRVTVGDVVVDGEAATGTACRDFREGSFVNANGSHDPADVGFGVPALMEYSLVDRGEGVWWIESITEVGTC